MLMTGGARLLRSRFLIRALIALLLASAAGFQLLLANPLANLRGFVYSEATNQRIRHASVWLCDSGGNRMQESITNDSGEFAFLGLQPGAFILRVSASGYESAEMDVDVNFGTEHGVSIFLKTPKNSAVRAPLSPSISAHELSMPKSARDLVESGKKKLYADKNPQRALNDFESAVAKAPDYYEALYL